jgi:formylglycine-generating enzyme required for sulfatase activity
MGDDSGRPDERPAHRVTLGAFRLAVLPVTNEDYASYLSTTGGEAPRFWEDPAFNHPRQPVVGVSWYEAVDYCQWLRAATGANYRLPTEAEWERAALGGEDWRKYPWGETSFEDTGGRFKQDATWQVGTAPPNPYGLVDIGFNIHEWCSDWYDAGYYAVSPEHDPRGPDTGTRKASRGGAWRHQVKICRCAARSSIPPEYRYNDYGFRLALDVQG